MSVDFYWTLFSAGTFANRPTAGTVGRFYYATDTDVLYRDTGSAWVEDDLASFLNNTRGDARYLYRENTTAFTPDSNYEPATKKYVDDSVAAAGGGDMLKAVYDQDESGVVDDAEDSQLLDGSTKAEVQDHTPKAHKTSHQNDGADEISVTGLSGLLADDQHVLDAEVVAAAKTVKLDDFTAPDDTTDLDASAALHGLMSKADKGKLDGIEASAVALATVKADADVSDAITKKHTQNTDTHLGTVDQDISLNTHKLTNVVDPAANQDAATKKYHNDNLGFSSKAHAYRRTSAQSVGTGAWTQIQLNAEIFDVGSEFNTSTYLFTATSAGYYVVCGMIRIGATEVNKAYFAGIFVNGTDERLTGGFQSAYAGYLSPMAQGIIHLDADDTVQLKLWHNSVGAVDVAPDDLGAQTYLSIHRLS